MNLKQEQADMRERWRQMAATKKPRKEKTKPTVPAVRSAGNHELITSFIAYLRADRGASENTVSEYQRDIRKFAEWLGVELRTATRRNFQMYTSSLIAGGKSGSTARRRRCCFRTFYRFLMDEGEIEHDPTLNFPAPRAWKKLPKSTSQADVEKMVASLGTSPLAIRDKAMLLTFFGSGLRESELAALKLQDIDLDAGILKVVAGKGNKDAMLPMSALSIAAIKEYLAQVRPSFARGRGKSANLFLGQWGRPLTRQQVYYRVRDTAKAVLGESISPMNLRHAYATALIDGGADIRDVQVLMRHTDIHNTEIYIHTDINYLRKFHGKHPRGKLVVDDRAIPDVPQRQEPQSEHNPRLSPRSDRVG
jgi:integrase/recombinase XerD